MNCIIIYETYNIQYIKNQILQYLNCTGGDAVSSMHLELALDVLVDVAPDAVEYSKSILYDSSNDCVIDRLSYGDTAGRPPAAPGAKLEDPDADDETAVLLRTPMWSEIIFINNYDKRYIKLDT